MNSPEVYAGLSPTPLHLNGHSSDPIWEKCLKRSGKISRTLNLLQRLRSREEIPYRIGINQLLHCFSSS